MAIGDAAAGAGLAVFSPTQDKRLGYQNDNVRGDELAAHMTSGTHPANKITGQLKTAQLEDGAVTTIKVADAAITDPKIKDSEVKTRALATYAVTGPKLADTITKNVPFVIEGNPLSIRGSVAKITAGANVVIEGGLINLVGDDSSLVLGPATVLEAGSSFTVNADGSLFLEPDGYVTSMSIYSHTSTTAKANVYIDGNGRLQRTTATATTFEVDALAALTARVEALEAAATTTPEEV